jgi:hypothetical protein
MFRHTTRFLSTGHRCIHTLRFTTPLTTGLERRSLRVPLRSVPESRWARSGVAVGVRVPDGDAVTSPSTTIIFSTATVRSTATTSIGQGVTRGSITRRTAAGLPMQTAQPPTDSVGPLKAGLWQAGGRGLSNKLHARKEALEA